MLAAMGWTPWQLAILGAFVSIVTAVASLFAAGWALARLPADYFIGPAPPGFWHDRHPAMALLGRVGRTLLGIVLLALGAVMILPGVPGQGLLTILLGLLVLEFPGKRRLEQRFVSWSVARRAIDAVRRRAGKPPLVLESDVVDHVLTKDPNPSEPGASATGAGSGR